MPFVPPSSAGFELRTTLSSLPSLRIFDMISIYVYFVVSVWSMLTVKSLTSREYPALAWYRLLLVATLAQVRSRDSCKPNFRWIGIPVRNLPLLDPTQAKQAGVTHSFGLAHGCPTPTRTSAQTADRLSLGATTPAANVRSAAFAAESSDGSGSRKAPKGRGRVGKESCDSAVRSTDSGKACTKDAADSAESGLGDERTDRACGEDDDMHDVGETLSPSIATTAPGLGVEVRFFDC